MVNHVKALFEFCVLDKVTPYVKDKGSNLSTLIVTLTNVAHLVIPFN
jgi:hypothetical protein